MKQVGVFNGVGGEKIPLMFFGVVIQGDGDFIIPRGGNFLSNGMVTSEDTILEKYLEDTFTGQHGLEQPDPQMLPVPYGRTTKWIADKMYNVVGYGYLKDGATVNFPIYNTKEEAEKALEDGGDPSPVSTQIRVHVRQECNNNDGVHFNFQGKSGSDYSFGFKDIGSPDDARVDIIDGNNVIIRNHDNKKNGYFRMFVRDNKSKEERQYDFYSSTCNHDNKPTDCPHDIYKVDIDKGGDVHVGDELLAHWGGEFSCGENGSLNWYNDGVTAIETIDRRTIKVRVDKLPCKFHAQPNCWGCHGWSELIIF